MRARGNKKNPWNNLTAELRLSCFIFYCFKNFSFFFVWYKSTTIKFNCFIFKKNIQGAFMLLSNIKNERMYCDILFKFELK